MNHQLTGLENLGWNDWFEKHMACSRTDTIARVACVDRGQFVLVDQSGHFHAKLAGHYLYHHHLSEELPCVGDWVCVEKHQGNTGSIHSRLERRTSLRRKSAGDSIDNQMIAANVDVVIVVQSCHFDFNLKRLERYLVMVEEGGADPYILLTKTDLVEATVLDAQILEIRAAGIAAPVITLSNVTQDGQEQLENLLQPGKTYCFVGSSGVGKSTLINALAGRKLQKTETVSGTGEGRHTTVRRELLTLEGGALVIDNPGMREFGILGAKAGLGEFFSDINSIAQHCHFRDCSHTGEPGCAVQEAVNSGKISKEHYENFLKLREESKFYQLSYAEKRKKDRDFGRYIKAAKKRPK